MKLKALVFAFLFTLTTSAFAQYFVANPMVTVLPAQVSVQVSNPYLRPIICNGQVFGRTYSGHVFTTFFAEQFMPVGTYRFATVWAPYMNPFVTGWAEVHCRFAF